MYITTVRFTAVKIIQACIKIQCGLQQFIMKQSSVQKFQFTLQNTDAKQYTIIPLRLKHYISIQGIVQEYNTVYNNTVKTDNNYTVRLTEVHHDTVKCTKKQYSLHQYT